MRTGITVCYTHHPNATLAKYTSPIRCPPPYAIFIQIIRITDVGLADDAIAVICGAAPQDAGAVGGLSRSAGAVDADPLIRGSPNPLGSSAHVRLAIHTNAAQ